MYQVLEKMLRAAEINMADSVTLDDVDILLNNAAWAICSTYHTVLKASPGAAIFGEDMLFNIPFINNWNKIGDYRQHQTDLSTARKNKKRVNYDYKVSDRVLVVQDGNLCKAQSPHVKEPWTMTTVHTNGTISIQCGTKLERINILRVTPYTDDQII
jgi:hypothetical protein